MSAFAVNCELCPRLCHINRFAGEQGFCGAPDTMIISSIFPHHGEEPPISGQNGSGTIFFSYCTLKCCFCQNYQISQEYEGKSYSVTELADKMLHLQELGCHNVNLVTATHVLPWVLRSIREASGKGLFIPIVYNCSGYERTPVIALLNGIVDIYLPDMKYGNNDSAIKYSDAPDYVQRNQEVIREMFRQVGPLKTDSEEIAYRGLCIRHLVLPHNRSFSFDVLQFLSSVFDPQDITISLMAQYRPLYKAHQFEEINCGVSEETFGEIKAAYIDAGFDGFFQELSQIDRSFLINFRKRKEERLTGDQEETTLI